jgi:glycosyltransferase involved in cell wall biosynthesis
MTKQFKVLMITSEYPTPANPRIVPFIARQVDFLRLAGVEVDLFHFRGKKNLFYYIAAWFRLRRHTKGKSYDLMHAQWGHSAMLALPKRLPWVITFRGNDLEGIIGDNGKPRLLGKILTLVSKMTARMADGVIVVSDSLGQKLSRRDYRVIPSGLDLEIFRLIDQAEARAALGLPREKKLILFAASSLQNPRKRYALAQAAVGLVKERFDAELIAASGVTPQEIALYMNACDALLLTSVHEGSPNVVKEALACNLPVVSVDVGDVRRRIGAIEGCYVCRDDHPATIAADLTKVLENGGRVNSRAAVAELDERVITRNVMQLYKNVVGNHQKSMVGAAPKARKKKVSSQS